MSHFRYRTLSELQQDAEKLGATHVRFETDIAKVQEALARPVTIPGGFKVGNSMCIHPMEGCDGTLDGRPDELTYRRYGRFGEGGVKLIWFEATAVREDGRANTRQLWINEKTLPDMARLLETALKPHKEIWGTTDDVLTPVQLTHSGRYSVPKKTIAYHNPLIDHKSNTPPDYPVISDGELERLEDAYVEAAKLALRAGYRAIDIKVTHGYLLAELMGAKVREGRYGGSLDNRMRMLRNIIGKVRAALGSQMIICVRLGCMDGIPFKMDPETKLGVAYPHQTPYPHGFGVDPNDPTKEDLAEVKQAIAWLKEWGVSVLNVSIGCPYYNPHIGRPFEKADEGNYEQPEHPMLGVDRHFRIAGQLQHAQPDLPMVGTGYSWLQVYAMNAGARNLIDGNIRFMGIGRGALSYPDFAKDILEKGALDERRVCKTLTYCTFLMRSKNHPLGQFPAGCPPFDKGVYGPIMKEARHSRKQA